MESKYRITVPKGSAFTIKTDKDFIQLNAIILAIAKRGTGKTTAISNILRMMKDNNVLDRLILVSPTCPNNKHYSTELPLADEDMIEPESYTAEVRMELL